MAARALLLLLALAASTSTSATSTLGPAGNDWTDLDCDDIKLCDAAWDGKLEAVQGLLAKGAAVDEQNYGGSSALASAALNGHGAVVAALLQAGARTELQDGEGWTALMRAVYKGHAGVATALIAAGARKTVESWKMETVDVIALAKSESMKVLLRAAAAKGEL